MEWDNVKELESAERVAQSIGINLESFYEKHVNFNKGFNEKSYYEYITEFDDNPIPFEERFPSRPEIIQVTKLNYSDLKSNLLELPLGNTTGKITYVLKMLAEDVKKMPKDEKDEMIESFKSEKLISVKLFEQLIHLFQVLNYIIMLKKGQIKT